MLLLFAVMWVAVTVPLDIGFSALAGVIAMRVIDLGTEVAFVLVIGINFRYVQVLGTTGVLYRGQCPGVGCVSGD
jgi:hypothetical protein